QKGTPAEPVLTESARPQGSRVLASPLARRIAQEKGLDLGRVTGSGPGGRIVRQDVDRAAVATVSGGSPAAGKHIPPPARPAWVQGDPEYSDEPLSSMRKIIATRMVQSLAPVPHFYLT